MLSEDTRDRSFWITSFLSRRVLKSPRVIASLCEGYKFSSSFREASFREVKNNIFDRKGYSNPGD